MIHKVLIQISGYPLYKVGCIRVTHPCAGRHQVQVLCCPRLACIRPAASVHPEPGSNFHCFINYLLRKARPRKRMYLNPTTIFNPKRISDGAFYYLFKHLFQRTLLRRKKILKLSLLSLKLNFSVVNRRLILSIKPACSNHQATAKINN